MTTPALTRLLEGYYNSNQVSVANPGGLANDGHEKNFPLLLQDIGTAIGVDLLAMAEVVAQGVLDAQDAAASALNAPGTKKTSASTVTLATGTRVFNVPGALFGLNQTIVATDLVNKANYMVGLVKDYADPLLTVEIAQVEGPDAGAAKSSWGLVLTATGGVPISRKVLGTGLAVQSSTGALSADVTINVPAATVAQMLAATSNAVGATPKVFADMAIPIVLADAPTVAWNAGQRINAYLELTADREIGLPTNLKDGWTYGLILQQDGTGGRRPTWNAAFDLGAEGRPTPNPAPDAFWVGFFTYFAITGRLHLNGRSVA